MRSIFRYAICVVLGAALVAPALAQDAFPDTPENHWAYAALENLKREGILVGYPDGLYRGGRPASRYEMAVAIYQAYRRLKGLYDGLDEQIRALNEKIEGTGDMGGLKELRDQLAALQNDVAAMKSWGDDIENLKKLTNEFSKELDSLSVDVEAIKKDLSDLGDRVSRLEKVKPAVEIHGDANIVALAGHGKDRGVNSEFGITPDGRLTGVGRGSYAGQAVGFTRDLSVLHEVAFRVNGTNDEGPKWHVTVVTGNVLSPSSNFGAFPSGPLGSQGSSGMFGTGFLEGDNDIYIQDAVVSFDTSIGGFGFGAAIGRQGYQISKYIMQRQDWNPGYWNNARWDDGNWYFDGGLLTFDFGGVKLNAFGGRESMLLSTNSTVINGITRTVAGTPVDQFMGLHLTVPLTNMGSLDLAYLWLDSNTVSVGVPGNPAQQHNRTNVFGADINLMFGNIGVSGGYSKTPETYNTSKAWDSDNIAYYVGANYDGGNWGIDASYNRVEAFFAAPGDWGRVGLWWNPTDVTFWRAKGWFNFTPDLKAWVGAGFYEGIGSTAVGPFSSNDDFRTLKAGLEYGVNTNLSLMASYEDVEFKGPNVVPVGMSKPTQRWFTVGLGYKLGADSKLNLRYQTSDVDFKGTGFNGFFGLPNNRYRGGLFSSEVSVKF